MSPSLQTAVTTGSTAYPKWGLSWSYDRYGNRTAQSVTHGSGPSNSVSVSASTNRVTGMGSFTFSYDASGNLTQDDLYKYKYDAENRLVEIRQLNDALVGTYTYDGHSLRVIKVVGPDRTFSIYAGAQLVSEFEDAASNSYTAGTTPGQAPGDTVSLQLYQHNDHLSARFTTDNQAQVSNQQAHYPFGESWYSTGTADPSVVRKFTSYTKEPEAAAGQLNYATFREHSARLGRFHMADPVRGRISNPQRLNRYAYTINDPGNRLDPTGLFIWPDDSQDGDWRPIIVHSPFGICSRFPFDVQILLDGMEILRDFLCGPDSACDSGMLTPPFAGGPHPACQEGGQGGDQGCDVRLNIHIAELSCGPVRSGVGKYSLVGTELESVVPGSAKWKSKAKSKRGKEGQIFLGPMWETSWRTAAQEVQAYNKFNKRRTVAGTITVTVKFRCEGYTKEQKREETKVVTCPD